MGNILLLFLVLFPMLLSAWVFPLRRRDRRYRNWLIQIIPAVELAAALLLLLWPGAALELPGVFGFGLRLQAGSLGSLLALVSAFLWAATGLNCPSYFAAAEGCNRFYFFWLLTLGALMGVFLAADLFTLFVFFEMMSFTSYVWVVQNETEEARQAGQTYLAVAVIGGWALLAGLLLLQQLLGTLEFSAMAEAVSALPAEKRGPCTWPVDAHWWDLAPRPGCSPAHLAAKSPSRGAGTGVCPAVRHPDQERCFRCAHSLPVSVLDRASLEYSGTGPGRGDHGAGSCAGAVLRRFEADAGLLLHVPDRLYSGGHSHAGLPERRERPGGLGHGAAHAEPLPHQAGVVCGGRCGVSGNSLAESQ